MDDGTPDSLWEGILDEYLSYSYPFLILTPKLHQRDDDSRSHKDEPLLPSSSPVF